MTTAAAATEPAPAVSRDVRVDSIGFVDELKKQLADKIRDKVKSRMTEGEIQRVAGEYFEGLLVTASTSTIDAEKLFKLYKGGKVSEKDFVSAIAVVKKPLEAFMSARDIDRISVAGPPQLQLRVTRKKDVSITVEDALRGLNLTIEHP